MSVLSKVILFVLILASTLASADCNHNSTLCQILKNRPSLEFKKAIELSALIIKASTVHKIPPRIFTAILMQESKYDMNAKNCTTSKVKTKLSFIDIVDYKITSYTELLAFANKKEVYKVITKCYDFGIGQINIRTINAYGFVLERITQDIEYSIFAAAEVLSDFRKSYASLESDWWTRYNASSEDKRSIYKDLVVEYL